MLKRNCNADIGLYNTTYGDFYKAANIIASIHYPYIC